jgi:WD40 repeat protein
MDETVKIWDFQAGQEVLTLRDHRGHVRSLTFSADGTRLVSASRDRTVRIWDATPLAGETGQELLTLTGHSGPVCSVAFSPDGQWLASAGRDGTVLVWNQKLGDAGGMIGPIRTFDGCGRKLAFSPNGRFLASGGHWGPDRGKPKVWATGTWKELFPLGEKDAPAVAFSPDSEYLATCHFSSDFTIEIREASTGRGIHPLTGHVYAVRDLAFGPNPDVPQLASASVDGTVRIWDVRTGKEIEAPLHHTNGVLSVAFSPDGRLLASGGFDRVVHVWDARTWKLLYELPNPTGRVVSLVFHPKDSRVLAWGSTDATVKVWDEATKETHTFHGHTNWVEGVAFSPDGEWIASASLDGTVKIWKTPPLPESNGGGDQETPDFAPEDDSDVPD